MKGINLWKSLLQHLLALSFDGLKNNIEFQFQGAQWNIYPYSDAVCFQMLVGG